MAFQYTLMGLQPRHGEIGNLVHVSYEEESNSELLQKATTDLLEG